MAASVVAGALALMLDRDPAFHRAGARFWPGAQTTTPTPGRAPWTPAYGHGKLDVGAAPARSPDPAASDRNGPPLGSF